VAQFRASLRSAAMSSGTTRGDLPRDLDVLDDLCDHFLEHHTARRPVSMVRVQLWETLNLLTTFLHCWTKLKPARLGPRLALLEHHLRTTSLSR
jgi:hypothetical protein